MTSAGAVAEHIGAEVVGDASQPITGLGSLANAEPGQLSHLSSPSYRHLLPDTRASVVILAAEAVAECPCTALVVDNPYLAFARASQLFAKHHALNSGVHPSAVIGEGCVISPDAAIGANVVIGAHTEIAAGAMIHPNTTIGEHCRVGADAVLFSNVAIYRDVQIGPRSQVHSGTVIGAAGFGFTPGSQGQLVEIAQLGGVRIGADVSIGACTTIDCGAIDDTVIEDGVKIDNQVQIGHNCRIGAHTMLCGCVGIVGSTVIGKHCVFAGGAGVGGTKPVTICDGVVVTARTVVSQSVDQPGVYSGTIVFHEHKKWLRNAMRFEALDDLFKRVRNLERSRN
ncbi:MAG: UDP-3-O-(3-hydroxymyristoyl)glucosamine N-acyltransferase [Pseudomonadota bacterium]